MFPHSSIWPSICTCWLTECMTTGACSPAFSWLAELQLISFIIDECVPWLILCAMAYILCHDIVCLVYPDLYCVSWLTLCISTYRVYYDFHCVPYRDLCAMTFIACHDLHSVPWFILCTVSYIACHDLYCVPWLILCTITYIVYHDLYCVPWLVCHDLYCMPWLILCTMTRAESFVPNPPSVCSLTRLYSLWAKHGRHVWGFCVEYCL